MEIQAPVRVFKVGEKTLKDPDPHMTLAQVKNVLSMHHPEIINAQFGQPDIKGEQVIYTTEQKVGKKG